MQVVYERCSVCGLFARYFQILDVCDHDHPLQVVVCEQHHDGNLPPCGTYSERKSA